MVVEEDEVEDNDKEDNEVAEDTGNDRVLDVVEIKLEEEDSEEVVSEVVEDEEEAVDEEDEDVVGDEGNTVNPCEAAGAGCALPFIAAAYALPRGLFAPRTIPCQA